MGNEPSYDVIVAGGGPGGSVAAKLCSEAGFTTLLIEQKKLPRDKVCTGMVMGSWAHEIIRQEFGEIPESVLVNPPRLQGHRLHVSGTVSRTLEWQTPLTWRKNLDFWMLQHARQAGVTVWEASQVVRVRQGKGATSVAVRQHGATHELRARFVIGADGSLSAVRKSLFPELRVRYSSPRRECYVGQVDLDKKFIHWFFPRGLPRPRFNVNHKNDVFLIEGSGIKELRTEINEILGPRGLCPGIEPEWKDGCAIALLHDHALAGTFVPAQGNVLLVGDAAGLIFPITFEGIGSALKSGVAAAEAIATSARKGSSASTFYLKQIEPIMETVRRLCAVQDGLKSISAAGPDAMADALVAAYRETLTIQDE